MEEASTSKFKNDIAYNESKRLTKAIRSGIENYCCMPTCKSTQYKWENNIKTKTELPFLGFQKGLNVKNNGCRMFQAIEEKVVVTISI